MTFEDLQKYVQEKRELIRFNPSYLKDPLNRATEFLLVQTNLNDARYLFECDKARLQTITEGLFKQAKDKSEGKNITEKKVDATVDPKYTEVREILEDLEAKIKWIKTEIDIFNNAHLTYRQLSRE